MSNAVTLISANWGVIAAAIVAFGAVVFEGSRSLVADPTIQLWVVVFLVLLWLLVGALQLYDRGRAKKVSLVPDIAWGLGLMSFVPAYDPENESMCFQVGLSLVNSSAAPLQYEVRHFEARIRARSMKASETNQKFHMVPRGLQRTYWCEPFPKSEVQDFIGQRTTGSLECQLAYGIAGKGFTRLLTVKASCDYILRDKADLVWRFTSETDEPLIE